MSGPGRRPPSGQRTGIVEGWELREIQHRDANAGGLKGLLFVGAFVVLIVVGGWFVGRPTIGSFAANLFEDSPGIISFPIVSDLVATELGDRANVPAGAPGDEVKFEIEEGQSVDDIQANLVDEGLLEDTLAFKYLVVKDRVDQLLQAGVYTMSSDITPAGVVALMKRGPDPPTPVTVLDMRHGRRIEQVAAYLQQQVEATDLELDVARFVNIARDPGPEIIETYRFLRQLPQGNSLEGFLAGGTYEVGIDIGPDELIQLMLDRWEEDNGTALAQARKKGVDFYDMIKIASLVEREAKADSDRAKIAGVYWNRLDPKVNNETGGLMQADPTVVYATDSMALNDLPLKDWDEYLFWDTLGVADYATVDVARRYESFQTYRNPGLPKWPIASPSSKSIQAALNPNTRKKLLYFYACEGADTHKFAKNFRGHQRNIRRCD